MNCLSMCTNLPKSPAVGVAVASIITMLCDHDHRAAGRYGDLHAIPGTPYDPMIHTFTSINEPLRLPLGLCRWRALF